MVRKDIGPIYHHHDWINNNTLVIQAVWPNLKVESMHFHIPIGKKKLCDKKTWCVFFGPGWAEVDGGLQQGDHLGSQSISPLMLLNQKTDDYIIMEPILDDSDDAIIEYEPGKNAMGSNWGRQLIASAGGLDKAHKGPKTVTIGGMTGILTCVGRAK